ncbi:MAG: hypothetical protein ACTTKC_11625 [Treponema sp.]|uniref:hypothetical protein n=1 Tax=Treponema sp. TaxID=166 RepID=UPI003FA26D77
MKLKRTKLIVLCLVSLSAVYFTGCVTLFEAIVNQSQRNALLKDAKGTPEDSVVIYGGWAAVGKLFQANTSKAPNPASFYTEKDWSVSTPLVPGGRYREYFNVVVTTMGRDVTTTYYVYGLNGNGQTDFMIPNKTGIYYYGDSVSNLQSTKVNSHSESKTAKQLKNEELKALKNVYRVYAKTAWGPLFKARMEELKNEK